ncbi:lactate/malate family dehydrogenase [uncultured Anaerococcus sp.]|uniref:lactate/malate family dehydrogenase n=1 Tax=uncultured Anaerococcus sp. TaxID=293428 RepID=UPI00343D205A
MSIGRQLGIIDLNEDKAEGDAMDLSDSLSFTQSKESYKADYSYCRDAEVAGTTVRAPQNLKRPGMTS